MEDELENTLFGNNSVLFKQFKEESEEESEDVIIDVEGFEQFLKVSENDDTLLYVHENELKHMLKERAVKLYESKEAEFPEAAEPSCGKIRIFDNIYLLFAIILRKQSPFLTKGDFNILY